MMRPYEVEKDVAYTSPTRRRPGGSPWRQAEPQAETLTPKMADTTFYKVISERGGKLPPDAKPWVS